MSLGGSALLLPNVIGLISLPNFLPQSYAPGPVVSELPGYGRALAGDLSNLVTADFGLVTASAL